MTGLVTAPYMQRLERVFVYDEPDAPGLDIDEIGAYLASWFPQAQVFARSDFLTHQFRRFKAEERKYLEREVIRQLERARVTDLAGMDSEAGLSIPTDELGLDYVFRADAYQTVLRLLLDPEETCASNLHIVFCDHAICSWSVQQGQYSLHIVCMGSPSILSTGGFPEALPPPKEYEFRRAQIAMLGLGEEALDELAQAFAGRTVGYVDSRLNEICKGYALMCCLYRVFGEAFCPDRSCRLYAARNQEELLHAQCGPRAGLCDRHETMLQAFQV
jgi:hypothetical protein